jgi:hypothetical protein
MQWISDHRNAAPKGAWWRARDASELGDLISMGYLENVPRFRDSIWHNFVPAGQGNKRTDLYIWGDSYVKDIPSNVFYGINAYHYGRRDYIDLLYHLDATKNNILVIEIGERFFRGHFAFPDPILQHVKRADGGTATIFTMPNPHIVQAGLWIPHLHVSNLFNSAINQNIEYNLFSYNAISPIRRFKAEMNAFLFQRGSGDVVITEDGSRLLLLSTVMPRGSESSYLPIDQTDKERMVRNLNTIYQHYKSEGFSEVYLSVIPNTTSLIQPQGYNMLIPFVTQSYREGKLKMPVIGVYEDYLKSGDPGAYYLKGDTHWNDKGMQLWIGKINTMLKAWDEGRAYRPE